MASCRDTKKAHPRREGRRPPTLLSLAPAGRDDGPEAEDPCRHRVGVAQRTETSRHPVRPALPERPAYLVAGLSDGRSRASDADEELSELTGDVLVAPVNEELDVLDDLKHGAALVQRLR